MVLWKTILVFCMRGFGCLLPWSPINSNCYSLQLFTPKVSSVVLASFPSISHIFMATLPITVFHNWSGSMLGIELLNFCNHKLNSLRHLRMVPIHPELLRAATQFWDPDVHVFRFGAHELCPIVEEFRLYLDCHVVDELVIPLIRESMWRILRISLRLNSALVWPSLWWQMGSQHSLHLWVVQFGWRSHKSCTASAAFVCFLSMLVGLISVGFIW